MSDTHDPGEAALLRTRTAAKLATLQLKLAREVVETSGFAGPNRDLLVSAVLHAIALNHQSLS